MRRDNNICSDHSTLCFNRSYNNNIDKHKSSNYCADAGEPFSWPIDPLVDVASLFSVDDATAPSPAAAAQLGTNTGALGLNTNAGAFGLSELEAATTAGSLCGSGTGASPIIAWGG